MAPSLDRQQPSQDLICSSAVRGGGGEARRLIANPACDLLSPAPAGLPRAAWPAFSDWPGVFAFSELPGVTNPPAALLCMMVRSSSPQCLPDERGAQVHRARDATKCDVSEKKLAWFSRSLACCPPDAQGNQKRPAAGRSMHALHMLPKWYLHQRYGNSNKQCCRCQTLIWSIQKEELWGRLRTSAHGAASSQRDCALITGHHNRELR